MAVETGSGRSDYQLRFQAISTLASGRYELIVHGDISDGGLQLGVLDVDAKRLARDKHVLGGARPSHGFVLPFELEPLQTRAAGAGELEPAQQVVDLGAHARRAAE